MTSCNCDHNTARRCRASFLSTGTEPSINSGHSVGLFTFRSLLFSRPTYMIPSPYINNVVVMSIDANVIISMLTLFVSCIPGVWFLLRFRERHQRLPEQVIQDPETGLRQAVSGRFQYGFLTIITSCSFSLIFPFSLLLPQLLTSESPSYPQKVLTLSNAELWDNQTESGRFCSCDANKSIHFRQCLSDYSGPSCRVALTTQCKMKHMPSDT